VCSASEEQIQIVHLREEEGEQIQHEGIMQHFCVDKSYFLQSCGFFFQENMGKFWGD